MRSNGKWPDPREFWRRRRVCVTGGAGFLGSFVVEALRRRGAERLFGLRSHTPFEAGLRRTIEWYQATLAQRSVRIPALQVHNA